MNPVDEAAANFHTESEQLNVLEWEDVQEREGKRARCVLILFLPPHTSTESHELTTQPPLRVVFYNTPLQSEHRPPEVTSCFKITIDKGHVQMS